jgi:hypothetical protein
VLEQRSGQLPYVKSTDSGKQRGFMKKMEVLTPPEYMDQNFQNDARNRGWERLLDDIIATMKTRFTYCKGSVTATAADLRVSRIKGHDDKQLIFSTTPNGRNIVPEFAERSTTSPLFSVHLLAN